MNKKTLFASLIATLVVIPAFATDPTPAERKTVTSKVYVDTQLTQKQNLIPKKTGSSTQVMLYPNTLGGTPDSRVVSQTLGDDTNLATRGAINSALNTKQDKITGGTPGNVVTYNSGGGLTNTGTGIYKTNVSYTGQEDTLITADTLNTTMENSFNAHITCADTNPDTGDCWLYEINQLDASTNKYLPHRN